MKVFILGGSSPTGIAITKACLLAKYTSIILYARSPEKIPKEISTDPTVTIVVGQLDDIRTLSDAMEGADSVFSVLGPKLFGHSNGNPISHLYEGVMDVIIKLGIKRLIAISTPSFTDPNDKHNFRLYSIVKFVATFAKNAYNDVIATGHVIRSKGDEAGLEYTLARIAVLGDGKSDKVVAGYVGDGKTTPAISRAAVAKFFVDEQAERNWLGKAPYISSP